MVQSFVDVSWTYNWEAIQAYMEVPLWMCTQAVEVEFIHESFDRYFELPLLPRKLPQLFFESHERTIPGKLAKKMWNRAWKVPQKLPYTLLGTPPVLR